MTFSPIHIIYKYLKLLLKSIIKGLNIIGYVYRAVFKAKFLFLDTIKKQWVPILYLEEVLHSVDLCLDSPHIFPSNCSGPML